MPGLQSHGPRFVRRLIVRLQRPNGGNGIEDRHRGVRAGRVHEVHGKLAALLHDRHVDRRRARQLDNRLWKQDSCQAVEERRGRGVSAIQVALAEVEVRGRELPLSQCGDRGCRLLWRSGLPAGTQRSERPRAALQGRGLARPGRGNQGAFLIEKPWCGLRRSLQRDSKLALESAAVPGPMSSKWPPVLTYPSSSFLNAGAR